MRRADFEAEIGRNITLTPTHWAFAWLLGKARTASNPHRARSADRGVRGNELADLYGALGELAMYKVVRGLRDPAALEHCRRQLFIPGGGQEADGADLKFVEDGKDIGIDAKTFDCQPHKRYFAINDAKHLKLARDHCIGYMGLIAPVYGQHGCLTRIIPYEHVERWRVVTLRDDGSPSRVYPIDSALKLYCGEHFDMVEARRMTYPEADIVTLALKPGAQSVSERLIRLVPEIEPAIRKICQRGA